MKHVPQDEFISCCTLRKKHTSHESTYWQASYKGEVYEFCISSHHGQYRGKLYTFICSDHSESNARQLSGDMRAYIQKERADYEFEMKQAKTKKSK